LKLFYLSYLSGILRGFICHGSAIGVAGCGGSRYVAMMNVFGRNGRHAPERK